MPHCLHQACRSPEFESIRCPEYSSSRTSKEVDIGAVWSIIIFTTVVQNCRGLADARRPGSTIETRYPKAQWDPQSPAEVVTDPLFRTGDFFDPHDLVQVKYEMLRRVRVDKQSVSQSASSFGFSRPTFYQAEEDFQRDGLAGLLSEERGPRQGHKLTPNVLDFAIQLRASDPAIRLPDLAASIQKRFAITAHPRSIERALGRQEKKRR